MATKNIVPRANGEGGIGTSVKRWLSGFFKNINVDTEAIVPTPANNDNSTKAATTAFVENTFFNKLVAKLLATTAATITSLSTSSLFYRFLAQALSVAGVQYNLSNSSAWYICLGSLFGGLIIQGGMVTSTGATIDGNKIIVTLPISFTSRPKSFVMVTGEGNSGPQTAEVKYGSEEDSKRYIQYFAYRNGTALTGIWTYWLSVGF